MRWYPSTAAILAFVLAAATSAAAQPQQPPVGAPFETWTAYILASAPPALAREPLGLAIASKRLEFDRTPSAEARDAFMRRFALELSQPGRLPPEGGADVQRGVPPSGPGPMERRQRAGAAAIELAAALGTGPAPQGSSSDGGPREAPPLTRGPEKQQRAAPPSPDEAPAADPQRQRDIEILQAGITPLGGVRAESIENARRALAQMMSETDADALHRMAEKGFHAYVVPKNWKVTDAPAFAGLKGKEADNGIHYDKAAGIARDDALVIKEDDLRKTLWGPRYTTLVHEFGHAVEFNLTKEDQARLDLASWKDLGAGLRKYARTTSQENTAEATAAFFGVGEKERNVLIRTVSMYIGGGVFNSKGQYKRLDGAELKKKQPELYERLRLIYGVPRRIEEP